MKVLMLLQFFSYVHSSCDKCTKKINNVIPVMRLFVIKGEKMQSRDEVLIKNDYLCPSIMPKMYLTVIMRRLLLISLFFLLCIARLSAFTVVIDPGHGGRDAGAVGLKAREKDINLKVALALGDMIRRNHPEVKVIYTRKTDVFVELGRRAQIAVKAKADLFISVHTNSTAAGRRGTSAHGTETFTLGMHRAADNLAVAKRENSVITLESDYKQKYEGFDPGSSESYIIFEFMQDKNMEASVKFARMIQRQFVSTAKRADKGVHQAGFLVLREVSMPSVLIELGFINNRQEEKYLASSHGQTRLAQSIYNAFKAYYKKK